MSLLRRKPQGSVLEVYPCGEDICARIAFVRKDAPSQFDRNNPDESLRNTPLCGMQIGRGFHPLNAEHADAGKLYDPKTGKTYDGEMTAEGDALHLRGYLGIKAFGRTQDWTRTTAVNCADNH